jgi:hypothetical protein
MNNYVPLPWVIAAFIWVPISFFIAYNLNNLPAGTVKNVAIPLCYRTPNGAPTLFATSVSPCIADRTTYGIPFPSKRVYHLHQPLTKNFSRQKTYEITRYVGLSGEELSLIDQDYQAYKFVSWNFITVLIAPFMLVGIWQLVKRSTLFSKQ